MDWLTRILLEAQRCRTIEDGLGVVLEGLRQRVSDVMSAAKVLPGWQQEINAVLQEARDRKSSVAQCVVSGTAPAAEAGPNYLDEVIVHSVTADGSLATFNARVIDAGTIELPLETGEC